MKSGNELVMERPADVIGASAVCPVKSILFVLHDDDGLDSRLQIALSFARACSAHLQLLQVIPIEAYTVVDAYGGTFASGEIVQALEEQAANLRSKLEARICREDVSWGYEVATAPTLPALLRSAALADLMVVGRQPAWRDFTRSGPSLVGSLMRNMRTPLCIPGDGCTSLDPFGNAVIAWNGSFEAANAVRASVGILRMASEVRIVRYTEAKEAEFPDTRLLAYLSRHGISAVLDTRKARNDFVDDLLEYAGIFAAEYLVMGGYSHTRAGEFLFGGVTRELVRASPVSLVMAH